MLLPSRVLGYVAPIICLLWYLVRTHSGNLMKRTILFVSLYFVVVLLLYAINATQNVGFLPSNALVALLTYGSFVLIGLIDGRLSSGEYSYDRYARLLKYVILLQSGVGIFQYLAVVLTGRFDIIPGDAVQGTIGLLAFYYEFEGFGNQMFAINQSFFLLYFYPYALQNKGSFYVIVLGVLSLMLASVSHVFYSLIFAFLLITLVYRRLSVTSLLRYVTMASFLVAVLWFTIGLLAPNFARSVMHYADLYQRSANDRTPSSPRFQYINNTLEKLPQKYPTVYLTGLGPGQYSSRAGLIGTGKYFGSDLSFVANQMTHPFREYVFPAWQRFMTGSETYGNSTMQRPYFSWLSILAEFGYVATAAIVLAMVYLLLWIRKKYRQTHALPPPEAEYCLVTGVGILFLACIAIFENYLETTQAVLPGLMLMKLSINRMRHTTTTSS